MTEKVKRPRTGESTGLPLSALQKIYKCSNQQTQNIDIPITVRSTIWPSSHLYDWIDVWHFISQPFCMFLLTQWCFFTVPFSCAVVDDWISRGWFTQETELHQLWSHPSTFCPDTWTWTDPGFVEHWPLLAESSIWFELNSIDVACVQPSVGLNHD